MAPGDTTPGRRIYIDNDRPVFGFQPGDYGKNMIGEWWCRPPGGHLGRLDTHEVVEHEDGTITVSPSIVSEGGETIEESWHGFLERGVWREV